MAVARRAEQEAYAQAERSTATAQWFRERTAAVKERVSAHDVLRHFGHELRSFNSEQEVQTRCPFHGKDNKPSARVYPASAKSGSGLWCWTCQKRWDIFKLWKEFNGDPDMKFSQVLSGLERAFGIIPTEGPQFTQIDTGPSEAEQDAEQILQVCENRLREGRPYFEMKGFFIVAQLLDRTRYQLENGAMGPEAVQKVCRKVLDKIGEKIRGAKTQATDPGTWGP